MPPASQYMNHVPQFACCDLIFDTTPYIISKPTKNAATTGTTLKGTFSFQGYLMKFYFSGIHSKNIECHRDYLSVHGETC